MNKVQSLQFLEKQGLNIHNYSTPTEFNKIKEICEQYINSSVRFDDTTGTLQLPFMLMEQGKYTDTDIASIINIIKQYNCYPLISDGRNYDANMEYNISIKIQENGYFEADISNLKIPLRNMFNHPLMALVGNIAEPIHWWKQYGITLGNKVNIRRIIETIYSKEIFNKYIECTTYTTKVGKLSELIAYWHIWE